MIYRCKGCQLKLTFEQTHTVLGEPNRWHAPCGVQGVVVPDQTEPTDDLDMWIRLLSGRTARYARLLQLDAPMLIINEERRMIREAAAIIVLFEPIPVPKGGAQ